MAWIDLSLPLEDADLFVRLYPFPPGIHGATVSNGDGTFSVYLREQDLFEQQQDDYWHEYKHIACDDFGNGRPIEEIEEL